jgi:hypothetical protein
MNRRFKRIPTPVSTGKLVGARTKWPGGRPGPDRLRWIIRPDDLVVLAFDLVNLKVQPGKEDDKAQLVKQGSGAAYLIVRFPPQNIAEIAFFSTEEVVTDIEPAGEVEPPDEPPIQARLAGWSRLVFRVPDERLPIDWTLEALLLAMNSLELSVPANALPPQPRYEPLFPFILEQIKKGGLVYEGQFKQAGGAAQASADMQIQTGMSRAAGALELPLRSTSAGRQLLAASRARRQARLLGSQFGITSLTYDAASYAGKLDPSEVGRAPISPFLLRPEPQEPSANQTALELPYRLLLSPNHKGAWFHTSIPATSLETGHTELWHTRLGVRHTDGSLTEGDDPLRTVRAVWALDTPAPETPQAGEALKVVDPVIDPWRMSLDNNDRLQVVQLSSNFRLREESNPQIFYEPPAIEVDLLALSSLGAWLDSLGHWDDQPAGLSVEEWRHRATLGRDHYARVVYSGFLFPWGHRASLVKVTERNFHPGRKGNPAYLRQRMYIVVREPLRTYRGSGLKYTGPEAARADEQFDLMMPFSAVRLLTRVSPLIDPPEYDDIDNLTRLAFWPNVAKQPFKFRMAATDTAGNQVDMAMPLIFIDQTKTDQPYDDSPVKDKVLESYTGAKWPNSDVLRATVPLNGQKLAFAESAAPDDTSFSVQTITFGAEVPLKPTFNKLPRRQPRFFPTVRSAQANIPALQSIARTTAPAGMVMASHYLKHGFGPANSGQVFLAADPAAPKFDVAFSGQGDRSGGLVTPDLRLSGMSRLTGPVSGDLGTAAAGSFDPNAWFGALAGAKLFGVFSLADILAGVGFDELDKLPQFAGQSLNQVEQMVSGLDRLDQVLAGNTAPQTAAVRLLLHELLNPTTGSIPAVLKGGSLTDVNDGLLSLLGELEALKTALPGSSLLAGEKAAISSAITSLPQAIGIVLSGANLLQAFADGDLLPEAMEARFDWRPEIQSAGPFEPGSSRGLLLSVRAAGEDFSVTCSLDAFDLNLAFLLLKFDRVQLRLRSGEKPEVDVAFNDFEFIGPLSFVQTLREIIPLDGFSDPPDIQVTSEGILAGFSVGLPNLAIGVFSLENLALAAGFSIPFIGPPLSVWFRFCERENPARLTVSMFGGGFFFGLTVNADELYILEGAIEFGAAISVNFGVASGSVSAMAGLYFKMEGSDATLAGYFRLRGEVEALGIVSICIELYLEMRYETGSGKCVGTATISVDIEVAFFSTSISITCTKKFAGGNGDPTFAELMDVTPQGTSADWEAYCMAFG